MIDVNRVILDMINSNCLFKKKGWFKRYLLKGYFTKHYYGEDNIDIDLLSKDIEDMVEVLNSLYKENWTFYFYDIHKLPEIRILFPEVTIKNTLDRTHIIRDLIVAMSLSITDKRIAIVPTLRGLRLTVTKEEFVSGYQHSHLNGVEYESYNFSNDVKLIFCLGTNEVPEVITVFNDNHEIGTFELLLLTINSMISWESLEGVPYKRIENISLQTTTNRSFVPGHEEVRKVFNNIIFYDILKELDFDMNGKYIRVIENDNFKKKLFKLALDHCPNSLCIMKNGYYFKHKMVNNKISYRSEPFYFKNQVLKFKVYNNRETGIDEDTLASLQIHPTILKDVTNKINNYIYEKCIVYYSRKDRG